MVLSTYLAYSLKLAVSMETAFPRDFRAWEEAHISSSAISSSKPLTGSSSFFTGVTLLLPISASPVEQKHRSTGWASRQRISGGMGARTEWGSCFHKRQRWEPVWKPLRPTHHPFPSFCVTSFWSRFQKWKKFYMNSTQLKARCAPQERAHQCMDLLWQIRKSWVTCSSQMTVFFPSLLSYSDLLTLHRSSDEFGLMVPSACFTMNFFTREMDLRGNGGGQRKLREPCQSPGAPPLCKASAQHGCTTCLEQAGLSRGVGLSR